MLKEFIFCPNRAHLEIYQKTKKEMCGMLIGKQALSWQKLVEGFNNKTSSQQIWSFIRCFRRKKEVTSSSIEKLTKASSEAIDKLCIYLPFVSMTVQNKGYEAWGSS